MKKIICFVLTLVILMFCLCGCEFVDTSAGEPVVAPPDTTYIAEFYHNNGNMWLSIEGSNFNISPNKTKNYMFDTSGNWTYEWETSSVVSIEIDGNNIENCGSTVLFYDSNLKKLDIEIPENIILNKNGDSRIKIPNDIFITDCWLLNSWWKTYIQANQKTASRIVLIQSQEGDPICMFVGDSVNWSIPKNLPKTTEIEIDGKMVYIHRANFAIIDTSIFE